NEARPEFVIKLMSNRPKKLAPVPAHPIIDSQGARIVNRARRFSIARSWRELWRRGRRGRMVSSACPCPARETRLETLRARRIRLRKVFLDRDVRRARFPLTCGH